MKWEVITIKKHKYDIFSMSLGITVALVATSQMATIGTKSAGILDNLVEVIVITSVIFVGVLFCLAMADNEKTE